MYSIAVYVYHSCLCIVYLSEFFFSSTFLSYLYSSYSTHAFFDPSNNSLVINLNSNRLVRLPRCVGRLPNLTSLSASHNNITYIPSELGNSSSLKILRLCSNKIRMLPERLGDLVHLEELSIDFNNIAKLPTTFWKLRSLKSLRIEGRLNGWMNRWMDGWMNRWVDGWMKGWMDRWMNGWIDKLIHWLIH